MRAQQVEEAVRGARASFIRNMDDRVLLHQVDQTIRGMLSNGIGAFLSSFVLVGLTYKTQSIDNSIAWLASVFCTGLSWVIFSLVYRRSSALSAVNVRAWLKACYALTFIHGFAFGSAALWLNTDQQMAEWIVIILYMLGSGATQLLAQSTLPWLHTTCFFPVYVLLGFGLSIQAAVPPKVTIAMGVYCLFLVVFSRELTQRFSAALRLVFEHEAMSDKLATTVTSLEQTSAQLNELAIRDELTGLHNRRYLFEVLTREMERVKRYPAPLSVLLMDIDHFKKVNDVHGHIAGDRVLKRFAEIGQKQLRNIDVFARYGGEEFSVLCSETPAAGAGALIVAERLRKAVDAADYTDISDGLHVTVSIGVATYRSGETPTELYMRADAALYRAKEHGRNRVECEDEPSSSES